MILSNATAITRFTYPDIQDDASLGDEDESSKEHL